MRTLCVLVRIGTSIVIIFDINLAVNYGTISSKTPKISLQSCTAEQRTTPMMSFFYDVIHL